ncbi:NAD(P)-dependent oxidoreductase [Cryobacterium sp. N19]|uniref:NAD(P)-dependent oxidoreductase n=1 Tax=Cryobacterium sp. N19 TaxID=2048288 RepID=UPI001304D974|nr:NAD(P)-dependent oxidoreductase [Cryobacterium sp. N19]
MNGTPVTSTSNSIVPSLVVLDDREGLLSRSPGVERMRVLADVRVLSGSLDELTTAERERVSVIMAVRERTRFDAVTLATLPSLELLLQSGGHAYHLDAEYAAQRGLPVALGRGGLGAQAAVPELTFALAVAAMRMIPAAHHSVVAGEWPPFLGRNLSGRTLGILGLGRHGGNVARIGEAYGMRVVAWDRGGASVAETVGPERLLLDELLSVSDVVTVHLKLSEESKGLLSEERLRSMKPGSVLINTARGAIIDEEALAKVLQSGPISAAGLDVFAVEPLPASSPLRSLTNVVLTPHIGWTVEEVLTEFADTAAGQLEAYRSGSLSRGQLLDRQVNPRGSRFGGLSE